MVGIKAVCDVTGAPNKGFLEQSVTSSDNPFLRANVQAIKQHQMKKKQAGTGPSLFSLTDLDLVLMA